jgi:hypothetical protein
MKLKSIIFCLAVLICSGLMSQTSPPGIPYQAIVRNAEGIVSANVAVSVKFTLHENTTDGNIEYQEVHTVTSNGQGLIALVIGQGVSQQSTFSNIDWSSTIKFLQVEMDLGTGYVDLGTQQMMSVPFAMYAAKAPNAVQSISSSNNQWVITFSDGSTQTLPIGNGSSATNSQTFHYLSDGF